MAQILTQKHGAPGVRFHTVDNLAEPGDGEVVVRFLAAPINPLDLLVLGNAYPVKPQFQHAAEPIPGYDGVGEVERCGPGVAGLTPGDTVVPSRFSIGTWRTRAVLPATALQKVERPADVAFACILRLTVAPAYCMVEDMRALKPGDWLVQNAGTSAIAQMVAQFARRRGAHVLNVIRDRADGDVHAVRVALQRAGVDAVLTESELAAGGAGAGRRVVLALDSVFGSSGRRLVKALSPGGTYVQLGFLGGGGATLELDSRDLFGRQVEMKAFRGSAQLAARTEAEQHDLLNWFVSLFNRGALQLPVLGLERVEWAAGHPEATATRVVTAVARAQAAQLGQRKQILVFSE